MPKSIVYGEIKITMHSQGIYFDGDYTDEISEQAQRAYLEIAEIVARYCGDSHALSEIRQDFAELKRAKKGGRP